MEPRIVQNWLIQKVGIPSEDDSGMILYVLSAVRYLGTAEEAVVPTMLDGESITMLGGAGPVFDEIHNPRKLTVSEGIELVGAEALLDSLAEHVILPRSCRKLGNRAFANCSRLNKVDFPLIGFVELGSGVFAGCTALQTVQLPAGCMHIPAKTFAGCTALQQLRMPAVCLSVGEQAFAGCTALTGLRLPVGCRYVFGRAFEGCTAMRELQHGEDTFVSENAFGTRGQTDASADFTYRMRKDYSIEITGYMGSDTVLELPAEIDGAPVTGLGEALFAGRGKTAAAPLLRVTLSPWVKEIGSRCFADCDALEEVQLPERLYCLGESAFEGCTALRQIILPRMLRVMESRCFADCTALETAPLPPMLAELGWEAFAGCTALTELPANLRSLPKGCFAGCTGLREIAVPGTLTEYGPSAFAGCTGLQRVTLEEGCPTLPEEMFAGCTGLQNSSTSANEHEQGDPTDEI